MASLSQDTILEYVKPLYSSLGISHWLRALSTSERQTTQLHSYLIRALGRVEDSLASTQSSNPDGVATSLSNLKTLDEILSQFEKEIRFAKSYTTGLTKELEAIQASTKTSQPSQSQPATSEVVTLVSSHAEWPEEDIYARHYPYSVEVSHVYSDHSVEYETHRFNSYADAEEFVQGINENN